MLVEANKHTSFPPSINLAQTDANMHHDVYNQIWRRQMHHDIYR